MPLRVPSSARRAVFASERKIARRVRPPAPRNDVPSFLLAHTAGTHSHRRSALDSGRKCRGQTRSGNVLRQFRKSKTESKSAQHHDLGRSFAMAPALLFFGTVMSFLRAIQTLSESSSADSSAAFWLIGLALVVLIAIAGDDDLPGPRRCFARAGAHR